MNKIDKTEAHEVLVVSDKFVKQLSKILDEIKIIIHEEPISKNSINMFNFFLTERDSLLFQTNLHLESLEDITQTTGWKGWWTRKVAISYMKDIRQHFFLFEQGMHVIKMKHPSLESALE